MVGKKCTSKELTMLREVRWHGLKTDYHIRRQKVGINGLFSIWVDVTRGMLQGSALGTQLEAEILLPSFSVTETTASVQFNLV